MVLPARNIIFALGGVALSSVIFLGLFRPGTHRSFCATTSQSPPLTVQQKHHDRKLHLLLPINAGAAKQSPDFCKTLLSALVHGYEPTIINWDVEHEWMEMQRMKVNGAHAYLTNITGKIAENDLVLLVDALDVWFQVSPKTLIERFEELHAPNGVILGAEINCCCWPYEFESVKSFTCRRVPKSTLPQGVYTATEEPRSANSGTVIGSVASMRSLFKDLYTVLQEPERQTQGDQGAFNEFLASGLGNISLDYRSRLFWATAYTPPTTIAHFINTPYHIDSFIPHELYPPLLYHETTGEVPALIHFNGPEDKPLMEEWWGKLWWNMLHGGDGRFRDLVARRLHGATVKFAGGGWKEWNELCPKDVIGI